MVFKLIRTDGSGPATDTRYQCMDDAIDAMQVLEDFDRAEGFFKKGAYAIACINEEVKKNGH